MLRATFIAIIGIATSISLSAQHFDIRAYGGVNVLQLTSDQGTSLIDGVLHNRSVSGRPGFQYGAAVTFGDQFYVQPGIQFTTLSTTVTNENTTTGAELTDETTLSIISVPLKFGVRLVPPDAENWFNVRLFGGFDGHHVTSVDHGTNHPSTGDLDEDDYTNMILNADFGMGIDVLFLFVDAGYQLGLTPVHTGGDGAKSNAFYANLGLRISL